VDDRGAQPRRLSRFRELKFTYVGFFSPCNPKDKTTVSPAMLITTSRVALTAVLIRVDPAANSQRGRTNLQYLQA
jgi:hypothetical protein